MSRSPLPALSLAATLCACATAALAAPAARSLTLYVAPNGNDAWSGKLAAPNLAGSDGPLASLPGARDAIRRSKAAGTLKAPVKVLLRGGMYSLPEPFVLTPQDSGTDDCPVTYAAYPGERPIISGGDKVTRWRKTDDGLWTATIRRVRRRESMPRELWIDGRRRTLARSPNTGYFTMVGRGATDKDPVSGKKIDPGKQAFRFRPEDIEGLGDLAGANIVAFFWWETGHLPISGIDRETDTMVLTGEMKWPFWADQRYYIENTRAALDAPGEWFLDRATERLYYKPLPGEDPSRVTAVLPRLGQVLLIKGDPQAGLTVDNIRFEGLQFSYAGYALEPTGHCDWQAACTVPSVIEADGASKCSFERCEVSHIGNYGICFHSGCKDNSITQCEITDIGAGGVRIGGDGNPPNDAMLTRGNKVVNCFIHDIGVVFAGAIGVWVGQSSDNLIDHNEICDTNYTAISVGWTWGYGPTTAHRNLIEYNHLHHLARGVLGDMGAIYTLGPSPGTVERYNLIHDIWCFGYGGGGIYPDEGSSEILIENNVVYNTVSGGLTFHYGRNCTVRNNIFAFARDQQIVRGQDEEHVAFHFDNNIVYFETGRVWSAGGAHRNWTADGNCYFNTAGEPLRFAADMSWEDWQRAGFDRHGIVADPKFVNAGARDFRLQPDSPALKVGFKPIDISPAGLIGPADWVAKPRKIKRPPLNFGAPEQVKPRLINDGFEHTPVGATADGATTWGETATATVRVTEEQAATGKRSLKFQDQAGLDQPWNPHIWYSPNLYEGFIRLQYDLRLEPGAEFCNELRDAANPYRVGPSVSTDAKGALTARGKPVTTLPANAWVHFDITTSLGKQSTHKWNLTVTIPHQAPVTLTDLPCDQDWKALEWLGFISNSTTRLAFFLDNVKLELLRDK